MFGRERIRELEQESLDLKYKLIMEMQKSLALEIQVRKYQKRVKDLLEQIKNDETRKD